MKKAEIILGIIALIALILSLINVPGSGAVATSAIAMLSVLYMYFSFAFFNDIELKQILKKESYAGISAFRIIGSVCTGIFLASTIIGVFFKFNSFPGASNMLVFGLAGLVVVLILGLIKYQKGKSDFYKTLFKRVTPIMLAGIILMGLPKNTWLEMKYKNHPEYIEAVKNLQENPNDQALRDKLDEERRKMNADEE